MPIPVILDTDIGTDVDDTWALVMLLRSPELDLKLVTTASADTVYRARLAAKLLDIAGRSDVPVGVGIRGGSSHEFQAPWVGDYRLADYPGAVHEDGVDALVDVVRRSADPVTIVAIGAALNVKRALEIAPDIASKCRLVGMYGSIDRGYGRGSSPCPEANVRNDVPACRAVFAASWRDIVITPLDTCDDAILSGDRYRRIRDSRDPLICALVENTLVWARLVTWVDASSYIRERSSTLFDTVAVYLAYTEARLDVETLRLAVTDDGRTVRAPGGSPVRVALRWTDLGGYLDHLVARLLGEA
jgi:inosine-uridine nucleoside N-ribohydrolase